MKKINILINLLNPNLKKFKKYNLFWNSIFNGSRRKTRTTQEKKRQLSLKLHKICFKKELVYNFYTILRPFFYN